jgi:hypothetical protein
MDELGNDLMFGAGSIAKDVFGKNNKKNRRKVYYLHQRGLLGTFKMGGEIAGRRSTIRQKIAELEAAAEHESASKIVEHEAASQPPSAAT